MRNSRIATTACLGTIIVLSPALWPSRASAALRHPLGPSDVSRPNIASTQTHDEPAWDYDYHDVGIIRASVDNTGAISTSYTAGAGLIVGAIRGPDTLVTEGTDQRWPRFSNFTPEFVPYELIHVSSSRRTSEYYDPRAKADQVFTAIYSDTTHLSSGYGRALDEIELRPHKPIGIRVRQTSYAWSNPFARRFILVDYAISNITNHPIEQMCIGMYVDPDIITIPPEIEADTLNERQLDDIIGFLPTVPGVAPHTLDTMMMAWATDNDGDPYVNFTWRDYSERGVLGVRVLRAPKDAQFSFNWFANDHVNLEWGPKRRDNPSTYLGSLGAPFGDRARYRMMHNGEIDYDQVYAAVNMSLHGWRAPLNRSLAIDVANGLDTRCMLTYGPLPDLAPGDSVQFTVAFILGDRLHRDPRNFADRFDPDNPKLFLDNLDFSDLIENARWASWVYDNPGLDTDGDGDRGAAYLINCDGPRCDSLFYRGDGVPDFQGPQPPPAPEVEMTTVPNRVVLHWSGAYTELERDHLSLKRDFEGYRVYVGKFRTDDGMSLLASWDLIDYRRYEYDADRKEWAAISDPLSIDGWRETLDWPEFDPNMYTSYHPQEAYVDSVLDTLTNAAGDVIHTYMRERRSRWLPEEFNRNNEYLEEGVYVQNPIQQIAVHDTVIAKDTLSYGEYEITIDKLNSAVPLFFSVTTSDFGDYSKNIPPLSTSPSDDALYGQPINTSDVVVDSGLKVSVYPNPYKLAYRDGRGNWTSYYQEGYEGRGVRDFIEQDRRVHFINLPDTATIRIYTLDGDLVRTIHHPDPFLTTYSSAVGWDLVSRNAQAVVSGIYIWRVDSRLGTQMGKLVIIK